MNLEPSEPASMNVLLEPQVGFGVAIVDPEPEDAPLSFAARRTRLACPVPGTFVNG